MRYPTTDPRKLAKLKAALDRLEAQVGELERSDVPEYTSWKREVFDAERPVRITAMNASVDGVTVEELEDGSWRIGGDANADQLSIRVEMESRGTDLRSIILQPLVDEKELGGSRRGGRSRRGEVVLSHFEARVLY